MFDQINFLVMATDACNMRCKYCFHGEDGYSVDVLPIETFYHLIDSVAEKWNHVQIVWHGGEPLMVPLSFYEQAYNYCEKSGLHFSFSIQTNASLLNSSNIEFFKSKNTHFGISYDGITNESVRGNTDAVLRGIESLLKYDNTAGAIIVVTRKNVDHLIEEYKHFKTLGLSMKLNPLFIDGAAIFNQALAIDMEEYCNSFLDFYNYWVYDKECNINVQTCIDYTKMLQRKTPHVCSYNSCVGKWFCINHLGNIYPCDRLYDDSLVMGNVLDYSDFSLVYESDNFKKLVSKAITRRNYCSDNCELFAECKGGCNASAYLTGDIANALDNDFCKMQRTIVKGIKDIFELAVSKKREVLNPRFFELL